MSYYHIPDVGSMAPVVLDFYGRALIVETPQGHGTHLVPTSALDWGDD